MRFKFFLLPTLAATSANYQFASIILAEGFQALGVEYFGNIDYWFVKETGDCLIKASEKKADVHIYEAAYYRANKHIINSLSNDTIHVLIDTDDKLVTPALTEVANAFHLVLRAHYTSALPYPKNVVPWPFALSKRIIDSVEVTRNQTVLPRVLNSYRVHLDVRKLTNDNLVPTLKKRYEVVDFVSTQPSAEITEDPNSYWFQTGRRHDDAYYAELNQSLLGLTFGGTFIPKPYPFGAYNSVKNFVNRALLKFVPKLREQGRLQFIIQYDSWRFWETMISNACPVFLNFEQSGFQFPINPVAGKHYLDVDVYDMETSAQKILALSENEIKTISDAGRTWALEHYSPQAVSKRLINLIEGLKM